jgi:FkbM family methyltransferase
MQVIIFEMSKKDLPSYMVMFGACISIILLVAARHHPPSRNTIKEIWHGPVHPKGSVESPILKVEKSITDGPVPQHTPTRMAVVYNGAGKDFSQNGEDGKNGYEKIYNLMKNALRTICSNTHILKGENSKEPDVHICLDNITPPCTVYSFGIAYNWIFDDFMVSKGCDVFSFDPSMNVGKHSRSNHHLFEPIGIGAYSGTHKGKSTLYGGKKNYQLLSLRDIMQRYGHNHIDIIRMDTESAEWDVLKQWNDDNLWEKMDQLLLEVHMWDKKKQEYYSNALSNIPMALFHKAKNNHDQNKAFRDMTQVYELGFLLNTK